MDTRPHFYVVKKVQKLQSIADSLYSGAGEDIVQRFLNLNNSIVKGDQADIGQWLYLPQLKPIYSDAEIKQALHEIDNIYQSFTPKMKQAMAYGHRLLTFAEAQIPIGIGIWAPIYKARIGEVRNILEDLEQEFLATGREFGKLTPSFYSFREIKFRQLDMAMGKLIREIMLPRSVRALAMKHQLGVSVQSELLDLKRIGAGKLHLSSFPKLFAKLARLSRAFEFLGWFAVAIDSIIGAKETWDVCSLHPNSPMCYRTGMEETGRVGVGAALSSYSFWTTYTICNAAGDAETAGTGLIWCGIVAGAVSAGGANVGAKFGKATGKFIFNKSYKIYEHTR